MYKTIRHGENSLQYTILPQNDDFRIEGKLSSAGSNCGSRKSKAKRPKRRSFFTYLGLIFVCTVIVGAVLIPFLVSAECLPNPTEWFLKTKAALIKHGNMHGSGVMTAKEVETADTGGNGRRNNHHIYGNGGINVGKTVKIINKNGVEKIYLTVNKTGSSDIPKAKTAPTAYLPITNSNPDPNTKTITTQDSNSTVDELNKGNTSNFTENASITDGATNNQTTKEVQASQAQDSLKSENIQHSQLVNQPKNDVVTSDQHFVTEVRFESVQHSPEEQGRYAVAAPTIVVTTLKSPNNYKSYNKEPLIAAPSLEQSTGVSNTEGRLLSSLTYTGNLNSPRVPSNPNQLANNGTANIMPTITTRIIQVPLLKATAKKPLLPPVLVKPVNTQLATNLSTNASSSSATTNSNRSMETSSSNSDWAHSRLPYMYSSTYLQWMVSRAEDNVLLPALLGFALIGMILIVAVCLLARNKRTIVSSVRKRNRNDVEEQGNEDNATLLTNTNLSDED